MLKGGKGVNLFGPLSLSTGLGAAARGYVDALRGSGVEVDTYDVSGMLHGGSPLQIFAPDACAIRSTSFSSPRPDSPAAATLWNAAFDHRVNVAFWVWILPAARPEWRSTLACFDLIVTPSAFCTNVFAGETDAAVVTIPYVVDQELLLGHVAAYRHNPWIDKLAEQRRLGRKIVLFIMDASSYTVRKGEDVFRKIAERVEAANPGRFLFVLKTHSRDRFASRTLRGRARRFASNCPFDRGLTRRWRGLQGGSPCSRA